MGERVAVSLSSRQSNGERRSLSDFYGRLTGTLPSAILCPHFNGQYEVAGRVGRPLIGWPASRPTNQRGWRSVLTNDRAWRRAVTNERTGSKWWYGLSRSVLWAYNGFPIALVHLCAGFHPHTPPGRGGRSHEGGANVSSNGFPAEKDFCSAQTFPRWSRMKIKSFFYMSNLNTCEIWNLWQN